MSKRFLPKRADVIDEDSCDYSSSDNFEGYDDIDSKYMANKQKV